MSKIVKVTLSCFLLFSFFAEASYKRIRSWDLKYYKLPFETAKFQKVLSIDDPFTINSPNNEVKQIFDANKKLLGHIREIFTDTGCGGECAPLFFTIAYNVDGTYRQYLVKEGEELYKGNDYEYFNKDDYLRLDSLLRNPPKSFKDIKEPKEMLSDWDGKTGATKLIYRSDVIETAALTCFRIYQYNKQTQIFLKN